MIRIIKALIIASLVGGVLFFLGLAQAQDQTKPQPKKRVVQVVEEEPQEYTEEEYDAYEKATKEPDADKRVELLNAFVAKYPESKLMSYIVAAYQQLMYDYSNAQKWDKLIQLSEAFLKAHPDDPQSIGYAATGAQKLGQYQKFLDYALKVFAQRPEAALAFDISDAYKKLKDEPKYLEWTEKLFTYSEFKGEFGLRLVFVEKYLKEKKYPKAAEYAQLTLTSLGEAKKPDNIADADWNKQIRSVRRVCLYTRGINFYENKNYSAAEKELQSALKVERFSDAYYYIGYCYWKQDLIDEAIDAFAKANVLGGDLGAQAKEQLEKLYKGLHNNTLIGIDKVYNKAKQDLGVTK